MFAKISNSFINTSLLNQELRGDVAVSKFFSEKRNGGSAFFMLKNYSKVKEILLENIFTLPTPPSIFYAEFTGSGLVTPHIDAYNWTVALNCYINTSVDATIFYKKKHENVEPFKGTLGYNINDLIETSRFYSSPHDVYLMDISKIHGIEKTTNDTRSMITFRWSGYSFEEVYNSLNVEKSKWIS